MPEENNAYSGKLYERAPTTELHDDEVAALMPMGTDKVHVFAPANYRDRQRNNLISDAIDSAIHSENPPENMVFAIGPGHWRGVYVSRPKNEDEAWRVEIYDPKGKDNVKESVIDCVEQILMDAGIPALDIQCTGPRQNQQLDTYDCGDYVCAYSHHKMHELDSEANYNKDYATTLEEHGNDENHLRLESRNQMRAKDGLEPESLDDLKASYRSVMQDLNEQEQRIFKATFGIAKSQAFKEELRELIGRRNEIYEKAAVSQTKKDDEKSDEDISSELQAEEFTKAGFEPPKP